MPTINSNIPMTRENPLGMDISSDTGLSNISEVLNPANLNLAHWDTLHKPDFMKVAMKNLMKLRVPTDPDLEELFENSSYTSLTNCTPEFIRKMHDSALTNANNENNVNWFVEYCSQSLDVFNLHAEF